MVRTLAPAGMTPADVTHALPPDVDVQAEVPGLARLESEARQRPCTAELVERILEAASEDLAERVAQKLRRPEVATPEDGLTVESQRPVIETRRYDVASNDRVRRRLSMGGLNNKRTTKAARQRAELLRLLAVALDTPHPISRGNWRLPDDLDEAVLTVLSAWALDDLERPRVRAADRVIREAWRVGGLHGRFLAA